jgi:hypothetical protein
MRSILPVCIRRIHQPQPGFVHYSRRLERIATTFLTRVLAGDAP